LYLFTRKQFRYSYAIIQRGGNMDIDAMIVSINQEWSRLETREAELNKELSQVVTAKERLRNIKNAAEGKIVTRSPRESAPRKDVVRNRPSNAGAALGQKNRWYWVAKEKGDKETAAKLLADIRRAGKEPWKVKK